MRELPASPTRACHVRDSDGFPAEKREQTGLGRGQIYYHKWHGWSGIVAGLDCCYCDYATVAGAMKRSEAR
jgi:hypothetical protein